MDLFRGVCMVRVHITLQQYYSTVVWSLYPILYFLSNVLVCIYVYVTIALAFPYHIEYSSSFH